MGTPQTCEKLRTLGRLPGSLSNLGLIDCASGGAGNFFRASSSNSDAYSPQTIEKPASLSHLARHDRPNPTGSWVRRWVETGQTRAFAVS